MQDLLEFERAGWSSLCDGTASEFYGRIMTADGVMVLADGTVMSRAEVVRALVDAPAWDSFEISDPRVLMLGADAHVLMYIGTGRRAGAPPFVGVMTSTYVHGDEGWQLALYQQTPTASDPGAPQGGAPPPDRA